MCALTSCSCVHTAIATGYTLEEISKHWTYLEETLVPTLRECVSVCVPACLSVCWSVIVVCVCALRIFL